MLPTFFVIGAAKSGTTSLHYYLDQHPDVHMSREKEPNYFSFAHRPGGPKHVIRDRRAYKALFDSPAPVRGEASVTYSFWPHPPDVAERIHAAVPDAKFVYVVRDPVERTLSHYRHRVVLGEEHRSLARGRGKTRMSPPSATSQPPATPRSYGSTSRTSPPSDSS